MPSDPDNSGSIFIDNSRAKSAALGRVLTPHDADRRQNGRVLGLTRWTERVRDVQHTVGRRDVASGIDNSLRMSAANRAISTTSDYQRTDAYASLTSPPDRG